jgi:hypothetical protein
MEISVATIQAACPIREIDVRNGEYFVRFYSSVGVYYATITAENYEAAKAMATVGAQRVTDLTKTGT